MNILKKIDNFLTEDKDHIISVYSGRFHPFHSGHYQTYQSAVKKFGKDNVYIATSNKVELPKSPFTFDEKKQIITTLFDIPKDKVIQIKNPYSPKEVLNKFDNKIYSYVSIVGKKDSERLKSGKYFSMFKDGTEMEEYSDKGYVWVAPENTVKYNGDVLSGTKIRNLFQISSDDERKELFKKLYPKWNKKIFNLIVNKLKGENNV